MKNVSISKVLLGALCALVCSAAFAVEPAIRAQALTDAKAGRSAAALPVLEQLADTIPTDVEACVALSGIRLGEHKAKEAVALLEKAVEAMPERADYRSLLGTALSMRIGQVSFIQQGFLAGKMLEAYEKSIELDPNHLPGYIGLTRYYSNAPAIAGGSMEKAKQYAAEVEKRDATAGGIEFGLLAVRDSDWKEALKRFSTLAESKPENAWFQERRGAMLAKLGRMEEAKVAFQKALEIDPKLGSAIKGLGALSK